MKSGQGRILEARVAILGALFLLISLALMVNRFSGGLESIRQVSLVFISSLERPLSAIRVYRQTLASNDVLRRQNVLLQDELSRLRSAEQENQILRNLLNFKSESDVDLTPARIIAKELNSLNNFLTIQAGSQDGIEKGMPVVHPDGLIGQVILVSDHYAQVMPFKNALFRVSGRIEESRAFGILKWASFDNDLMIMEFVPKTIPVAIGQKVVTSGSSLQYPSGIPIGTILGIMETDGRDTWELLIQPHVQLNTVAESFVMIHKREAEVVELLNQQEELYE
jgi:rod shape-determining protein MreC